MRGVRSRGCHYGGARGGGGSRRAALRRRSPPRSRRRSPNSRACLPRPSRAAPPTERGGRSGCLTGSTPERRAAISGHSHGHASAATRSRGTRHRARRAPLRGDTNVTPNRRRRPKTPTSPASGVARGVHAHRDDRDDRGSGQARSAAGYSPDDGDASPRYRDFDARAVALEGGWQIQRTAGRDRDGK